MNALFFTFFAAAAAAQITAQPKTGQVSYGTCSPNISGVAGNVTLQFMGGCSAIDPTAVKKINEFLAEFPKMQKRLLELLDKKDVELNAKVKEIEEWTTKYRDLSKRLEEQTADDVLSRKASTLLKDGDLDRATKLLDQIIARGENQVDRLARDYYNRALAYDLQYESLKALPDYEKAYRYRPHEFTYALSYGSALLRQRQYPEAERVLSSALRLAPNRPAKAQALNNRGVVYRNTNRFKEAEQDYTETLDIQRQLAKENPAAFRPTLVDTLNNRGVVYWNTNRFKEAEQDYTEALDIHRQLAKENPAAFRPHLAQTLNNRANLYRNTNRFKEAEQDYSEALDIRRQLAKETPVPLWR